MKLSEAIREGAKIRPQCKGDFFMAEGSCAIGAAIEAMNPAIPYEELENYATSSAQGTLEKYFEAFKEVQVELDPVLGEKRILALIITHMNDYYDWTREEIADWLETIGY